MSAHTPGPWYLTAGGEIRDQTNADLIATVDGADVGDYGDSWVGGGIANARLIAAAPQLAAVLLDLVVMSEDYVLSGGKRNVDRNQFAASVREARAALALVQP